MRNSRLLWLMAGFLFLSACLSAQNSTVVIAEVLYDSPWAFSEPSLNKGEFISLYNYEEDDVNIGGWRVQITDLMDDAQKTYTYTIPTNTILQAFSLAVIAPYTNGGFNIGNLYDSEDPDSSGNITLYTQDLVFPDTRSLIRIYDAENNLQDELRYDGVSDSLPGETLLRASNGYAPFRSGHRSLSIQRKSITIKDGKNTISRDDYHSGGETYVQLYSFLPEEYSYVSGRKGPSTLVPEDVTLTGTVTKNQEEKASNITSSQVITGGKTVYLAEEEVVLEPGFEVKSGAEFELTVERDSFHVVPILTYNRYVYSRVSYETHAQYIRQSGAGVVSVQEVSGPGNFKTLKEKTKMDGKFCITRLKLYGICMLWDEDKVGKPSRIRQRLTPTGYIGDSDPFRAYIIAEFPEFCFVATHFSENPNCRKKMAELIINDKVVEKCKEEKKPIYVAGDMNDTLGSVAIGVFVDNGFEVLNDLIPLDHQTRPQNNASIDLILEYNKSEEHPYHRLLERNIPITQEQKNEGWLYNVSDHFPYFVKVKMR